MFLENLNSEELVFTSERPQHNTFYNEFGITFLDKFIYTAHKKVVIRWYRKPQKGNHIMPFDSACPKHWFKSVILGTYTRIIDSNNTASGLMADIDRFKTILIANNYPESYIENATH